MNCYPVTEVIFMNAKTAAGNRERQRRLRQKRKEDLSLLQGEALDRYPVRVEVSIAKSVRDLLSQFAADTGTNQEILVERALVEYISRYKNFLNNPDAYRVCFRPVKFGELCCVSICDGTISLVPKVKSFWDKR